MGLATTAIVPRDEEMVVESRAIVTGKVMEIATEFDASRGLVYSFIRLKVETVLKGQITESEVVLKELGGETDEFGTLMFGMPRFEAGQNVFLYLNTWPDGSLRVHQGFLGKFDIRPNPSNGRMELARQEEGEAVKLMASSGTGITDQGDLEDYTAKIQTLIEATAQAGRSFEEEYYSGVPMLAVPPGFDRDREFGKIRPMWALLNPSRPLRWFEPDSGQPVRFYVNTAGAPNWDVNDDVRQALNAWSTVSGSSVKAINAGGTSGCGASKVDGYNTVSFNNCDGYFAASSGCSGILAVGGIIRYSTSDTKGVSGMMFYRGLEANVSINPYALCNFTTRCQLQETLTHELGHALGLGHSGDGNATMYAYAHFDGRCASLVADDRMGITKLYPGSSNGGALSIKTASDLPQVKVERDYGFALEANGGSGNYDWSIFGGQLPSGLQLSQGGFLHGKPSVPGSYSFTLQVQDSQHSVSQKTFSMVVMPPNPTPVVTSVNYRKKKVFVYGTYFDSGAKVFVDGQGIRTTLVGASLKTKKAKLPPGVHVVSVVNEDGKQSNDISFVVP